MGQITILGAASAVPTCDHENTHWFITVAARNILVDCPGSPLVRLWRAGINPDTLTDIILTHFHPDHVAGFAPLLMGLWLKGRTELMHVYGLEPVISRARQMMDLFSWSSWPNFYPVQFHVIPASERAVVLETPQLRIFASPVQHMVPTMGLRLELVEEKKVLAYSCDTEPCDVVARLAEGADLLIHEATGEGIGHTSPGQAGQVARRAGARRLMLIHYPPETPDIAQLALLAEETFGGPVQVANDFDRIDF